MKDKRINRYEMRPLQPAAEVEQEEPEIQPTKNVNPEPSAVKIMEPSKRPTGRGRGRGKGKRGGRGFHRPQG
jgi:hypothetical protein